MNVMKWNGSTVHFTSFSLHSIHSFSTFIIITKVRWREGSTNEVCVLLIKLNYNETKNEWKHELNLIKTHTLHSLLSFPHNPGNDREMKCVCEERMKHEMNTNEWRECVVHFGFFLHTYISLSFPCVLFNCNEIKRAFPYLYFISIKHYTQGLGVHHQTRFFLLSSYTPTSLSLLPSFVLFSHSFPGLF